MCLGIEGQVEQAGDFVRRRLCAGLLTPHGAPTRLCAGLLAPHDSPTEGLRTPRRPSVVPVARSGDRATTRSSAWPAAASGPEGGSQGSEIHASQSGPRSRDGRYRSQPFPAKALLDRMPPKRIPVVFSQRQNLE